MKASQVVMAFELSSDDWEFVKTLIEDVKKEEKKDNFFAAFYTWNSAVKIFRQIEHNFLGAKDPTQTDLRLHSMLLHSLIAAGEALQLKFARLDPNSKAVLKFSGSDLAAYIQDLKITLDQWHADVDSKRVESLTQQILSGS